MAKKKMNAGFAKYLAQKKAGRAKSPNRPKMSAMGMATNGAMK